MVWKHTDSGDMESTWGRQAGRSLRGSLGERGEGPKVDGNTCLLAWGLGNDILSSLSLFICTTGTGLFPFTEP